jgi:two-component system cell cycle response regulator
MQTSKHRLRTATTSDSRARVSFVDQSTLKNSGLFGPDVASIPTLTFLSGDALGKELPLLQQQLTLGRGEESDVLIMDPSVSRKHIQLTCRKLIGKDGTQSLKVLLQDLGSKNGTLVNYRKVRRVILKPGDKICLGRVILKFEYRDLADQSFYDEIYRLATVDPLTSLLNKASITRVFSEELTKKLRYRGSLSVLLMDLDDFKRLNDMQGHLVGDRALQAVGTILRRNLRRQDKAGRFGGDEFLVVLPETGLKGAAALAERLRADLERSAAAEAGLPNDIGASIGVATYPADGQTCESLLEHADIAVYRAKARGKNRVEPYRLQSNQTSGRRLG